MQIIFLVPLTLIISVSGDAPAGTDCTCKVAELHNGWCDACKVGYVAGVEIKSEMLFEALDAHGHHIDPDLMKCESCQKALKSDGFCERCKWGFVAQELYYTKLTYYLAKGQTKDTAKINCSTCKNRLGTGGWCGSCKVGIVGNVAYKTRQDFEQADAEYRKLLKAVELSGKCELCAVALFMETQCPKCKISYKHGQKLPEQGS